MGAINSSEAEGWEIRGTGGEGKGQTDTDQVWVTFEKEHMAEEKGNEKGMTQVRFQHLLHKYIFP